MTTLDRYIFRQLAIATTIVLCVLILLAWFTQVIVLVSIVVEHGRSVFEFLGITLLLVPMIFSLIMPTAVFVAVLVVLDRLNSDSELAIMSAAGLSRWRILRPVIFVCIVGVVLSLIANLYAQPIAMRDFREKRSEVRADVVATLIDEGRFSSPRNGLMVHVKGRSADGQLSGIIFEDSRDASQPVTYLARRAQLFNQGSKAFLLLRDGSVIRSNRDRPNVDLVHFEQYTLDLSAFFDQVQGRGAAPQELFIGDLFKSDPAETVDEQTRLRRYAEGHNRLSSPLYTFVMMLIAFAALCEPQTTRRGRVLSIVVATVLGGIVRIVGMLLVNLTSKAAIFVVPVYAFPIACIAGTAIFIAVRGGDLRMRRRADETASMMPRAQGAGAAARPS